MTDRIPYTAHRNDLYAEVSCSCGHKLRLVGYNDPHFFCNVNADPRARECKCGLRFTEQWFRDGVEVIFPDVLTPAQVRAAGYLLYGAKWPQRLAEKLDVSARFMERISAAGRDGEPYDVPPGIVREIRVLAEKRVAELQAKIGDLRQLESAELQLEEATSA